MLSHAFQNDDGEMINMKHKKTKWGNPHTTKNATQVEGTGMNNSLLVIIINQSLYILD